MVSNKMDKTVVVAVANTVDHRLYHRSTKRTSKFAAHDPGNECKVGDQVVDRVQPAAVEAEALAGAADPQAGRLG